MREQQDLFEISPDGKTLLITRWRGDSPVRTAVPNIDGRFHLKDDQGRTLIDMVYPLSAPMNENLWRLVDEIQMSVRSAHCLQQADIKYIGELVQKTESDLLKIKHFGQRSLAEIRELLAEMGLQLGMSLDNWPNKP